MTEIPKVERNRRKELNGVVVSVSGQKTIKVAYEYKISHPAYHKEVKRKTVVHTHDEKNEAKVGDKVAIMETRPLSKLKRWRLVEILEKAPTLGV